MFFFFVWRRECCLRKRGDAPERGSASRLRCCACSVCPILWLLLSLPPGEKEVAEAQKYFEKSKEKR